MRARGVVGELLALRDEARARREKLLDLRDTLQGNPEATERVDELLATTERMIRSLQRDLRWHGWRSSPQTALRLRELDREIASLQIQMLLRTGRTVRGSRPGSRRVFRRARARSPGRPSGDDDNPSSDRVALRPEALA